jgi:hypothetical protein
MKKSEFKQLIKESVREVLVTEGFLSTIVAEVVKGIGSNVVTEQSLENTPVHTAKKDNAKFQEMKSQEKVKKLQETKKRMLDAIGKNAYGGIDVFEGTTPMRKAGSPGEGAAPSSALSDVDPSDPGVDISDLMGGSASWKQLIK